MPCSPWDVPCVARKVGGRLVGGAVDSGVDAIAAAIRGGLSWVVENTVAWWIKVPSIDPAAGADVSATPVAAAPVVTEIQTSLWFLTLAVAVGGMVAAGIRMALTRKPDPLVGVGRGLAVLAATAVLGVAVPAALLRAGDEFSTWVLRRSLDGDGLGRRLTDMLGLVGVPAGAVLVLGTVAMAAAFVQALLMMFREASVLVLTGCLLLAASGQFSEATRSWFPKVTGWMLALICYKPAAALVYAAAFSLAGKGQDARSMLVGFTLLVLSLVALPALVRLFTWGVGNAVGQTGGGAAAVTAGAYGLMAVGAMSGRGQGGAGEQARFLNQAAAPAGAGADAVSTPGLAPAPPAAPMPAGAAAAAPGAATGGGSAAGGPGGGAAGRGAAGAGGGVAGPAAAAAGAAADVGRAVRDGAVGATGVEQQR